MSTNINLPQPDNNEEKIIGVEAEKLSSQENSQNQNTDDFTKLNKQNKILIKKDNNVEKKFLSFKKLKNEKPTEDALQTRKFAWLAYILFFIPLLINRNSEFVRHNANEGLEINIIDVVGLVFLFVGIFVKTTATVSHLLTIICFIIGICLLVLTTITKIYMIVVSSMGKKVTTPWLAKIKIIK